MNSSVNNSQSLLRTCFAFVRVFLLLVVAFFLPQTPVWGMAALPQPASVIHSVGYDVTVAYDGSQNSSSAYEDSARPPTTEEKHVSGAARTFLSRNADLVAAETTETLALPASRQVQGSWGAMNTYREGGQMTAIEHINYRHAFDSGFSNVSRYAEGTSASNINSYVDQALRYGNVSPQGAAGFKVEFNLGQTIGTNQAGGAANGIRVFIRNGNIQTAFPVTMP